MLKAVKQRNVLCNRQYIVGTSKILVWIPLGGHRCCGEGRENGPDSWHASTCPSASVPMDRY